MRQSEITQHTIKDTGIEVGIRRISPLLIVELRKSIKEPEPPMQEVDFGDGKKVLEPNLASPEYEKDKERYDSEFEEKMKRLVFSRGVVLNMDEERLAELRELREFWKNEYNLELTSLGSDKLDYISYIAVGTGDDLNELFNAIMKRSQATDREIENARKSF